MEQSGVDQVWARLKAATGQPSMDGIVGKVLRNGSSKTANLLLPLGGQSVAFLGLNDGQDDDVDQSSITAWQGATDLDRGDLETACRPYIQQLTDERISIRKAGMANIQVCACSTSKAHCEAWIRHRAETWSHVVRVSLAEGCILPSCITRPRDRCVIELAWEGAGEEHRRHSPVHPDVRNLDVPCFDRAAPGCNTANATLCHASAGRQAACGRK